MKIIHIIGGGLAGSEAAWQAAEMGVKVILHEMRPDVKTDAHKTEGLAELVCSNSFRSDDAEYNAVGLLHEEMRKCQSIIMQEADKSAVPAGGALAVDRDIFSQNVTVALESHPNITIERGEVSGLPPEEWENVIIATGPLTSEPLANSIKEATGEDALAFFDAIAPIIHKDSIDFDKAWFQSRYDKIGPAGTGKTYLAMAMAISSLIKKEVNRVILTRPAVEAGEKLGFLPGDMYEKVNPYLRPLYDALHDMMDFENALKLLEQGIIAVSYTHLTLPTKA